LAIFSFPADSFFVSTLQTVEKSTAVAKALADMYPSLHFIVQIYGQELSQSSVSHRSSLTSDVQQSTSSRISLQQRSPGMIQNIYDAAVYILHLPSASPRHPSQILLAQMTAELRAHLGVLHANTGATLVLTARLLLEPGDIEPGIEAITRLHDLSLAQLTNEQEIELFQIIDMINSVRDRTGRLVLANKLFARNNATVVFEIRYQVYSYNSTHAPPE